MVVKEGFEPSKSYDGRFTVCSHWPLGNFTTYFYGAAYPIRTDDLLITSQLLWPTELRRRICFHHSVFLATRRIILHFIHFVNSFFFFFINIFTLLLIFPIFSMIYIYNLFYIFFINTPLSPNIVKVFFSFSKISIYLFTSDFDIPVISTISSTVQGRFSIIFKISFSEFSL